MIRSILFQASYWIVSIFFALAAAPLLLVPDRRPIASWIRLYARAMRALMRWVAGVRVVVNGRERAPEGPAIIAAKHQSWGDGFIMMSEFPDLAVVAGDHLDRFPLVGGILRKMGAIVVDNCGGAFARAKLVDEELARAAGEGRSVLIYPEGHLAPVGARHRYKKGVFHMYAAYGRPALPVATNLGLFWSQQSWRLRPGIATVELLTPIEPGLGKEAFMSRLEDEIERASLRLAGREIAESAPLAPPLPDPVEA